MYAGSAAGGMQGTQMIDRSIDLRWLAEMRVLRGQILVVLVELSSLPMRCARRV
jgi:hypothetical protein